MDWLKEILGEELYGKFETAVNTYNSNQENKDKQVKIANVTNGYVEQSVYDSAVAEKNIIETNYNDAKKALKNFEGVNVEELQNQIATLNKTIKDNDKAHAEEMANMKFDSAVNAAITNAGGKNNKAIMALLDIDTLKASKNLDTDLKAALENCQKENDYLFASKEPINNPTLPTGGNPPTGNDAFMSTIDSIMGIKE